MFGMPFDEIAPMLDRTPAATCQLASRARRVVRGVPTVADPDLSRQREVVAAFLAAARAADFDALVSVLDPDVVFRIDTGGRTSMAPAMLTGSADVAHHAATYGPRLAKLCRPALVIAVNLILDPDKLAC
jgi:RNA polymerase sigma-70 factor (ECF subfamily)